MILQRYLDSLPGTQAELSMAFKHTSHVRESFVDIGMHAGRSMPGDICMHACHNDNEGAPMAAAAQTMYDQAFASASCMS